MVDLRDDPTFGCDYKSRCAIPTIKRFLEDLDEYFKYLPLVFEPLIDIKKKWEEELGR